MRKLRFTIGIVACAVACPTLAPGDPRIRCYGGDGRTSFYGHGLVDALAAART